MVVTKLNPHVVEVIERVEKRFPWEKEFNQAVREVLTSLSPVIDRNPIYKKKKILDRLVEPERVYEFRVPWRDDKGNIQINTGYRIGFNSAIGPYKGGLRFHASVTLSILKFLGFEQIFKNSLTGLPMGGGKGGSEFSPVGKSDNEVEAFCQSFMTALFNHIGANTDVPAGDIGVGGREIGFLFGQYRRLKNVYEGVLTGKGINWGGSLVRPEATGYGITYFCEEMLKTRGHSIAGKTVAVSGFGNVAWGVTKKVTELGGKVVTLSGPDGFIYDKAGMNAEKIGFMLQMRAGGRDCVREFADKFKAEFHAGKRPWGVKVDLAFPCATQNEMNESDAKELLNNGCIAVTEGANMPVEPKAIDLLIGSKILFSPGKASNAGGVACSGLEMTQNSIRMQWTAEEVDKHLHQIMVNIHRACLDAATEYGTPGNYQNGANIAGFIKVASAMIDQGNI